MRIGRALSVAGVCSRREAERLIAHRRVAVDGAVVDDPSTIVDTAAVTIAVDGKTVDQPTSHVYLAVHKPRGVTSTLRDRHAERTIAELAPRKGRLYPVGRLDKDSEGLILLTNDGDFANTVTHPRHGVSREYMALVAQAPTVDDLRKIRRGIMIDGGKAVPTLVENAPRAIWPALDRSDPRGGAWVRMILREGRNREVRRLLESAGHPVLRLIRTRIGPIRLAGLRVGQYRALKTQEVRAIMKAAGPAGKAGAQLSRLVVAIDGPAASGKTTVGTELARRLGATFLDTGVLYRALTAQALDRGVDVEDALALAALAEALDVKIVRGRVMVTDEDLTEAIRSVPVEANVSRVAAHGSVRTALVDAQRRAAGDARAVVVGRDIGTVIFPDADLKIFLEASPEERARRRVAERPVDPGAVESDLARRDEIDRARAIAPLVPADDAIVVDTDALSVEQVVAAIARLLGEPERRR